MPGPDAPSLPVWPLPLLIALLFVVAAHAAYLLSIQAGHVPACVPYVDGCVSISRAARHGVGNHLFRLLVIPCAVLHALVWLLAHRWLRGGRWMSVLGVGSAIALAVYATFLGTEGEAYRFLRRYGVVVYFGFGYLAQLALMRRASRTQALSARVIAAMSWVSIAMLMMGIGNVVAGLVLADPLAKDRWENVFEWWLGLLMVGWHAVLAAGWRQKGLVVNVQAHDPR
ncbi:hypothetical protein OVA13_02950 [Pseudoxanthomonas sp. SL93]|uniref:hypothetical protein n=1 Tax=Pseudoxanthomonas sp. SL93 TaxID=2995142 RepID=UPI002271BAD3|nr:hypothetical protein [Pseudoxanthomonas sp. SL93]WAC63762.1 hypothetical protein OVA13_02950 [Pseudoxanthomonas sp. SL93]